jgi:hypothetical protein
MDAHVCALGGAHACALGTGAHVCALGARTSVYHGAYRCALGAHGSEGARTPAPPSGGGYHACAPRGYGRARMRPGRHARLRPGYGRARMRPGGAHVCLPWCLQVRTGALTVVRGRARLRPRGGGLPRMRPERVWARMYAPWGARTPAPWVRARTYAPWVRARTYAPWGRARLLPFMVFSITRVK